MGRRRGARRPSWRCILSAGRTCSARCSICSRRRTRPCGAMPIRRPSRYLTRGLALLATLPETPAAGPAGTRPADWPSGPALMATKGWRPRRWSRPMPGRGRCVRRSARPRSSSRRCGAYVGSIIPGGVVDSAGAGGTALPAGAARGRADALLEAHAALGTTLFYPGRLRRRPDAPGAGDRPHRPDGAAGRALRHGRRLGCGAWSWRPSPVVSGLSGTGRAAESGGPGPGPGRWPIPIVWRTSSFYVASCITAAASRRRSRRRPRPS